MIVMKFDAASIGSHDRLRAVAQLVQQHKGKKPVVVTSALPKVTDLLLEAADLAAARQSDYEDRVQEVKALHEQVVEDLLPDGPGAAASRTTSRTCSRSCASTTARSTPWPSSRRARATPSPPSGNGSRASWWRRP
jgi:aspartokinase